MTIKTVILGFLSEAPQTGYDLKKQFVDSDVLHWSGNNNQIYKALVELHDEALVTIEVQYQESKPPRKVYTITPAGTESLHQWMRSAPELPQYRNPVLMQLMWADQLDTAASAALLAHYAQELEAHIVVLREQLRRDANGQASGFSFKRQIAEHWVAQYAFELGWVNDLRQELAAR